RGASLAKCRLKRVADDAIELEVLDNGFTLNMLKRDKNKAILKKICSDYFGVDKTVTLSPSADAEAHSPKKKSRSEQRQKQKALSHPLVADAIEIFNAKLIDVKIR
ncbi:MAG: hypothetical protein R3274_08530, partial [Desulfobacterales bacterium]|nr:hypothetical protein [Desulfobacterales bacterium]